jgi:hypothetical protein
MRRPSGNCVVEEREIYALQEQLKRYSGRRGPFSMLRADRIALLKHFRRGMSGRASDSIRCAR